MLEEADMSHPPAEGARTVSVNVELPADLEAVYANFVVITHSPSEIVLDFARVMPNLPKAKVYSRVVMTPMNAKALLKALGDNLQKFEDQFGEIKMPAEGFTGDRPIGFKK